MSGAVCRRKIFAFVGDSPRRKTYVYVWRCTAKPGEPLAFCTYTKIKRRRDVELLT